MSIYRRQIRIPRSKLPIQLTTYRTAEAGMTARRRGNRITSAPRRVPASLLSAPPTVKQHVAVSLTLPLPPSINHQYATVNGRRILSSAGRAYKAQVGQLVWLNVAQSIDRSVLLSGLQSASLALSIRFYFTSALRRDVDGGSKIAQDALCEGLGINDNRIVETHLYKHVDKTNPRIEVSLTTAPHS